MKKIYSGSIYALALMSFISFSCQSTSAMKSPEKEPIKTTDTAKTEVKIKTQVVEYKEGETVLEGYLAQPENVTGKVAGILLVHDWTGVGPAVTRRADELAKMGYVAFAADIYGKGVRPKPPEAGQVSGKFKADRKLLRARAVAGLDYLKSNTSVDAKKTIAIGYCFGGTTVLELGRGGADVAGIVSFHGGLDSPTPADGKNIKGKVLVLHGADDPFVPAKDITDFQNEMRNNKVDWQMVYYGDAVHAFSLTEAGDKKENGAAYNALADKRSGEHMKLFFNEVLGQ
ncbi:MAG: dienelactone hydrolase family protein [Candidatus Sericytochromatia bacterium]